MVATGKSHHPSAALENGRSPGNHVDGAQRHTFCRREGAIILDTETHECLLHTPGVYHFHMVLQYSFVALSPTPEQRSTLLLPKSL